jgi:transcriptional regulator with XRE-family HTH domain
MGFKMNRLKDVAKQLSEREQNELESRYENGDWQLKSSLIALEIHRYLRLNKMTQSQLASKMGISPAMVTKLLSGKENLSLKTICGLEKALQIELLRVPSYEKSIVMNYVKPSIAASGMKFSEEEGSESYE